MVKVSASRAEDPEFHSRSQHGSHTSDLKNGTPAATQPVQVLDLLDDIGTWHRTY